LYVEGLISRRFSSAPWMAVLALLPNTFHDVRATGAGWVANRTAIVAMALSLPALIAYDLWRRDGRRRGAILGPLAFGVGLLAGEAALLTGVYLFSYALFVDEGPAKVRLARLAPYAAVMLVWRWLYVHLGYGAVGSGIYFDPAGDPMSFLGAAVTRLPALLVGQFAFPWADLWDIYPLVWPGGRQAVIVLAVLLVMALTVLLPPLWRRDRFMRFWAVGCLLSTLLMCSTFPHDRLLTGAGIGGMALVAGLLGSVAEGTYPRKVWWVSAGAGFLAFIHLFLGPALTPYRARAMNDINGMLGEAHRTISSSESVTHKSVVLVNPALDPFAAYFIIYREAAREPRPKHLRWLATGVSDIHIERIDATTLRVRPSAGFLSSSSQMMLRSLSRPMQLGERVTLSDATFEVSELGADGRPLEVLVRFRVELEDRSLEWMQWGKHGYVPFRLPSVGETVVVPSVDMREVLLGRG